MPPRRRRPVGRRKPAGKGRDPLIRISTEREWNTTLRRHFDRVIIAQFCRAQSGWGTHPSQQQFGYWASQRQFSGAQFVTVDVDLLQDLARHVGAGRLPTYQIYFQGKLKHSLEAAQPAEVEELLSFSLKAYKLSLQERAQKVLRHPLFQAAAGVTITVWTLLTGYNAVQGVLGERAAAERHKRLMAEKAEILAQREVRRVDVRADGAYYSDEELTDDELYGRLPWAGRAQPAASASSKGGASRGGKA